MEIIVNGACGRMGKELVRFAEEHYHSCVLAAKIDVQSREKEIFKTLNEFSGRADAIIDFSNHASTHALLTYAVARKMPLVIATTGHTEDELCEIEEAAKQIPIFFCANMSVGVAQLKDTAVRLAKALPDADIEIVETHHVKKLDSPSGTALLLAKAMQKVRPDAKITCGRTGKREPGEIGIQSVRRGAIMGIHEITFTTPEETITVKHEVYDRALFAKGAIDAALFLQNKAAGLYNMDDLTNE